MRSQSYLYLIIYRRNLEPWTSKSLGGNEGLSRIFFFTVYNASLLQNVLVFSIHQSHSFLPRPLPSFSPCVRSLPSDRWPTSLFVSELPRRLPFTQVTFPLPLLFQFSPKRHLTYIGNLKLRIGLVFDCPSTAIYISYIKEAIISKWQQCSSERILEEICNLLFPKHREGWANSAYSPKSQRIKSLKLSRRQHDS